ncbi:PDZ domain-containing protein [Nanoarchaeota archaeon]
MEEKMRRYELISIVMVLLVISMPVVFSQQISVIQFSGADGVNDFAGRGDTLTIKANVQIHGAPPDARARERVRLYTDSTSYVFFDSCIKQSGITYECILEDDTVLQNVVGIKGLEIRLMDTDGNVIDKVSKQIVIDSQDPVVKTFTIDPPATKGNTATFTYDAEDYAFSPGDTSQCSGIKEVQFISDGQVLSTDTGGAGECAKSNSFSHSFNVNGTQVYSICAQAVDFFGRTSDFRCQDFRIDNSGPKITDLAIVSNQGFEFTHVTPGVITRANVAVFIQGDNDDIVKDTVTIDLSKLNPSLTGKRKVDRKFGDVFIWENVEITNPDNCEVTVSAIDDLGNPSTTTLTCELPIDSTSPLVKDIRTEIEDDEGVMILPTLGTVYVDVEDLDDEGNAGIGFQKGEVFLDASRLGLSAKIGPKNCTQSGELWTCVYDVQPKVHSGDFTIRVNTESRDDLGNLVVGGREEAIVFDAESPTIIGITSAEVLHDGIRTKGVAVRGDTIEIRVRAKDFDTATADFTEIGLQELSAISCDVLDNVTMEKECFFSSSIEASGPYEADIYIMFSDLAGNIAETVTNVTILGLSEEERPNYWKVKEVVCSPKVVDRYMSSITNYPVMCQIELDPLMTGGAQKLPGVIIKNLVPGGPADAAGLKVNDIVVEYDGQEIPGVREFLQMIGKTAGSTVDVKYKRGNSTKIVQVKGGSFGARVRANNARISKPRIITADIEDWVHECTGDLKGYVSSIRMFNNGLGVEKPIMSIRLKATDMRVEEMKFSCPVSIFSEVEGLFTQFPELEDVDVSIRFYNQPMGDYANNIDDEVDKAVERAEDFLSWMDDISMVLEWAEVLCDGWNMIVNIITTAGVVLDLLGVAEESLKSLGQADEAFVVAKGFENICNGQEQARKWVSDGQIGEIADAVCGWLECKYGLLDIIDAADSSSSIGKDARTFTTDNWADFLSLNLAGTDRGLLPGGFSQVLKGKISNAMPSSAGTKDTDSTDGDKKDDDKDKGESATGDTPAQNPGLYLNVKESLVYSVIIPPLCIPGILYNLNKLRQIECRYALCMSSDVRNGMPVSVCQDAKHQAICQFVVGEIFNIIPIAPIISYYMQQLETLLSDPTVLATVLIAWGLDCQKMCTVEDWSPLTPWPWWKYKICAGLEILNLVGKSIETITNWAESENLGGESTYYCDQLEEHLDDLESNTAEGTDTATAYAGNSSGS